MQDIKLKFLGLSYLTYRNSLANSYQILGWIMSKCASREVLGIIILFILEFSSLKGWNLGLDQTMYILKNENYHLVFSYLYFDFLFVSFIVNACFIYCKWLLVFTVFIEKKISTCKYLNWRFSAIPPWSTFFWVLQDHFQEHFILQYF